MLSMTPIATADLNFALIIREEYFFPKANQITVMDKSSNQKTQRIP